MIPAQVIITEKPSSVKRFEFLMYIALLLGLANSFLQYGSSLSNGFGSGLFLLMALLYLLVPLVLIYLTAHYRKNWARWVLVVIVGIGAINIIPTLLFSLPLLISKAGSLGLPIIAISLIKIVLEIIAFCYIFSSASNNWFSSNTSVGQINNSVYTLNMPIVNQTWTKTIPRTNINFLIPCLLLVFGFNMIIALGSRELLFFWYMMLGVLAVFVVFFILENFVFKRSFENSQSKVDRYILIFVILRNILVLLNLIPGIQILGMLIGFFAVWLYMPLYIILITVRFSQTKKV